MTAQRIVVGVDGSDASVEALRWALEQAAPTGAVVVAIHAWHDVYGAAAPFAVAVNPQLYVDAAAAVLDRAIEQATGGRAELVEARVVHDGPAAAILDAARDADLVVVGSRGRGGFAGLLLGSVSQQVVHHAACPVVVIPVDRHSPT
jgi:nucleotide-binding universal stress UspA family protein